MERRFNTALEASKIIDELRLQLRTINYNKDLRVMVKNIEHLNSLLSSAEVQARQAHKPGLVDRPRDDLSNAIDYLEKLILIAKLSQ